VVRDNNWRAALAGEFAPGREVDIVAEAKKVLLVDDEPKIADVLETYLSDDGFAVLKAHEGTTAVQIFKDKKPDLVILDLRLPGMSGIDIFHAMRAEADTPILMLTSKTDEVDRIIGLELGADDYITKPFSPREVVARVKTVLRRLEHAMPRPANGPTGERESTRRIEVGALHIDLDEHEVTVDGKTVSLTPTEFRILEVLAAQPGRTFTRTQLLDKARAENLEVFDRTLDRHIANLRHKIETEPGSPKYILTVFGVGYKMSKNPEPGA
jgi:two-component system alkaline phosphatase synthesis response regulator PhoP